MQTAKKRIRKSDADMQSVMRTCRVQLAQMMSKHTRRTITKFDRALKRYFAALD